VRPAAREALQHDALDLALSRAGRVVGPVSGQVYRLRPTPAKLLCTSCHGTHKLFTILSTTPNCLMRCNTLPYRRPTS
jgi:hypothetical protein